MNVYAQALLDAAYSAYRKRQYAEAWTALRFAIGSGWRDALSLRFTAHLEDLRGDAETAATLLAAAVAIEPDSATGHSHLADSLSKLTRLSEAESSYRRAIELDPGLTEAYGGLARILHLSNRDQDALSLAHRCLTHSSDKAHAHRIVGTALVWLNRHDEAINHFRAAQAPGPDPTARNHEGMALLALGHFSPGWQLYDARRSSAAVDTAFRDLPRPMWNGDSDISGKTILLHAEQGLGDAIQFVRYAPLAAQRGALVWLEVPPALKPLVANMPGVAGVVARGEPLPQFELHCPLLNLPLAFGTDLDGIPAQVPYLHADPWRAEAWRRRLGTTSHRRIGIAWSGNPSHPDDLLRSISLEQFAPVLQREDCEFHVVQTGVNQTDAIWLAQLGVQLHSDVPFDFAETAALMQSLDLIISVDTALAHLAGALGRPTWLLLQFSADWRWLRDRLDTPWYPTMRLFRQSSDGNWHGILQSVVNELERRPQTP